MLFATLMSLNLLGYVILRYIALPSVGNHKIRDNLPKDHAKDADNETSYSESSANNNGSATSLTIHNIRPDVEIAK